MKYLFLFFIPFFTHAQIAQNIHGYCTDKVSTAPLQSVAISVYNSKNELIKSAFTDSNGFYTMPQIPIGRINLKANYVGYSVFYASNIELSSAKELILNIELEEKNNTISTIEIADKKTVNALKESMVSVSARSFNIEESNRYAGGFGDLTRMAQSFAGVASSDGQSNEIVIRGNNPRGLLWRIEGVEVSNPNHFPRGDGSAGGGISIIQSNVIDNSTFMSGAFPANVGNASSGVFDINLRKGNMQKYEHTVQVGVIGVELMSEGPMSKNKQSSYLIKYRYSTIALLQKIGIKLVDNTVTPSYQDLTFNFYAKTKKAGNFTFFGIMGMSSAGEKAQKDSTQWEYTSDKVNALESYLTSIVGIKHQYLFKNNKVNITSSVLHNYESSKSKADTFSSDYIKNKLSKSTIIYQTVRAQSILNYKQSASSNYRFGIIASMPFFSLSSGNFINNQFASTLDNNGLTWMLQAFIQNKYNWKDKLEFNTGLHVIYHHLSKYTSIEPRMSIKYFIKANQSIAFATGLHSRVEPLSLYYTQVKNASGVINTWNKEIKPTQSFHAVVSYDWTIISNLKLKTELYFQYLYKVPVAKDTADYFSIINYNNDLIKQELTNNGKGYNYGIELSLEKYYSRNYYFLFTSSLFNSKYFTLNKKQFNTRYNGNYIINFTIGKDFNFGKRKKMILGANTRLVTMGGNRYTPLDISATTQSYQEVYYTSQTFAKQYSAFFRWDIGIYFKMNRRKYNWRLSVDFQNITNQQNLFSTRYDFEKQTTINNYGLGFIPVINYKVEF
jgi:hypothetical protein